ncbi:membrane-associated, eicosanoid/glutathione metabolism protein [Boeremia exigua]|uniref:membrane-associated, eicosanoid/glutathione metabolism protein n=1 Tax=Boeremia exigua TaxID=749465 RepID=UPI001E8D0497|nr:membrane-associated, eicosanoid/glutathione metabolism protein [Boeremia exigua]KAH6615335.1 membrane-associated, eicosanoid/glutathione metabolism protein [Boeremia exigua]
MASVAVGLDRTRLLKPLIVLAGWTFVQEAWMYATRLPAISKYGVKPDQETISEEMKTKIPVEVRRIADNFNHLHEQPTVFYSVAIALTLLGDNHEYTYLAAWGYTGLRIVHSLFQSLVNKVFTRFYIFVTSSFVLAGLTGRAATLLF